MFTKWLRNTGVRLTPASAALAQMRNVMQAELKELRSSG